MAQHQIITHTEARELGVYDQLVELLGEPRSFEREFTAWNRRDQAAADRIVSKARAPKPATPQATTTAVPMATDRQIDYIETLIKRAWGYGLEPKLEKLAESRDNIAALTRQQASQTIDILREQY